MFLPSISCRVPGRIVIGLYGEVRKAVVEATPRTGYGVAVTFSDSEVVCVERPCGAGEAVRYKEHDPNVATVGLWVEPGGVGWRFRIGVEPGSLPLSFSHRGRGVPAGRAAPRAAGGAPGRPGRTVRPH